MTKAIEGPLSPRKKLITQVWLVLLILTPIILWVLPADFFDEDGLVVCPSRLLFNIECFGCGMTRAIMHMHHFDFDDAVYFNRGSFLIYPALAIIWGLWVYRAAKRLDIWPIRKQSEIS